ncbi:LXG domain-containing protein [Heyndrickxia coagulans]|uniref:LXG domain-containing protein n=1 Tax=Heyndrickxia coagulans TaxID=1398 RepID=UPI00041A4D61|nr:LXG domain-containing protein [Heyndrickxia coagulans]
MKVEFEELLHLQKEIDRSTKEMAARLETVRQKTNAISRLQSFKGKAADSAKPYFHTTHGEMIEALVTAARQVQHRYNQSFPNLRVQWMIRQARYCTLIICMTLIKKRAY